mgnify:CR=1 FL=1
MSTLYRHASNYVLFSRFVKQGCPLAHFLFILFGEALSLFFRSSMPSIKAIALPIANLIVLDAEFADDMTLYIHGDVIKLDRVQNTLQTSFMLLESLSIGINM